MNDDRRFEKYAYEIDTVQYTGKLPEGIAAEDKDGKKLVYKTINRNGENVFRQGYICLSLKSEKEAYISLERDFVEVHTKDGQCLFSVCKKEWNEELAHMYYNEESYDNTFKYTGKLPEGIATENKNGRTLLYRTVNRRGENVLNQGYICLFLKAEKEAYISLERDSVEVHTKDGQCLFSVCKKEWNEELAHVYYNEESYISFDAETEKYIREKFKTTHPVDIYREIWNCGFHDLTTEARVKLIGCYDCEKFLELVKMSPEELNKKYPRSHEEIE